MPRGALVILSGPSGVGKDTVIDAWREVDPRVARVVAYTTRSPRPGERDGVDYHFVATDLFLEKAAGGEFLEWKEVHGFHYATPLHDMERMLEAGHLAILKIDVQGAMSARQLRPDAVLVFLLPPSAAELERRIRGRGTEDEAVVQRRLRNAQDEIALAETYHHRIVNEDVAMTVAALMALFPPVG